MSMRVLAISAVCLVALCGCGGPGESGGPEPLAQVDAVHLMMPMQAAVDLDGLPGYDGLLTAVLFTREDRDKPVAVNGTLVLMMFDRRVSGDTVANLKPDREWTFTAGELARVLGVNEYGMLTYRFVLPWGPTPPMSPILTLVAKYLPPQGRPVYSAPVNVPLKPL